MRQTQEPLVVNASELALVLRAFIARNPHENTGGKRTERTLIGPIDVLSSRSGIAARRVFAILSGEVRSVRLSVADELLTAIDEAVALQDGRVRVLANPILGLPRFRQKLLAAGVTDESSVLSEPPPDKPCGGCGNPMSELTPGCTACSQRHRVWNRHALHAVATGGA